MKTENMKLLALQTGKYLELGEEGFFYGGKTITCPPTKSFDIQNVNRELILHIYADTEKNYDIKHLDDTLAPLFDAPLFEITLQSNNQKLIGSEVRHFDMRFNRVIEQTEPPLELKEICEKIGAVVYGGRYVLLDDENNGDVFCEKTNFGTVYYISKNQYRFIPIKDFNTNNDIVATVDRFFMLNKAPKYKIGNFFEEYSKQLRNEPNKFDELRQHFK